MLEIFNSLPAIIACLAIGLVLIVIEALTPGAPGIRFTAGNMLNDAGEPIDVAAVPDTYFTLPAPDGIGEGDFLRVRHEDEFHG